MNLALLDLVISLVSRVRGFEWAQLLIAKAVLDPATGDYLVSGQKMFTTGGHDADYIWLACRTDPDLPKHKGITTTKIRNAHGELAYGMHITWMATSEWCKDHELTPEKLRRVK